MKKILAALFCLVIFYSVNAQNKKIVSVRFDGFYQSTVDMTALPDDKSWRYLRFYPNGKVISVTSTGNASDLKNWFSIKKHLDFGYWELNENRLYFSTTSNEGTVIYDGFVINKFYLELKIKSLINGYADKETYYFVKMPGLK
jgi:hypothetical protein